VPLEARDLLLVSTHEPCVMLHRRGDGERGRHIFFGLRAPADAGSERVRPPESPESQMPRIVGDVLADESRALFEAWYAEHRDEPQAAYIGELLKLTGAGAPGRSGPGQGRGVSEAAAPAGTGARRRPNSPACSRPRSTWPTWHARRGFTRGCSGRARC
jgi:hypothetical protein